MAYELVKKLRELTPYDPIEGNYEVRLDANESFIELSIQDLMRSCNAIAINRYPDPYASRVVKSFAKLYSLNADNITAGNGSDELISIICSCFLEKGDKALTFTPDFSMYAFYSELYELEVVSLGKDKNLQIDVDSAVGYIRKNNIKAVFLSNPCNPTSVGLNREQILKLISSVDALVIIDEAYMDFWDESVLDSVSKYDNLIVLKTCSKAIGLAAIRLGFAVANKRITTAFRAAKSPYNVNTITQTLGESVLSNPDSIRKNIDKIMSSRNDLYKLIKPICEKSKIIEHIYETVTNFVFIKTDYSSQIWEALLAKSIAVRNMKGYLRITCGTDDENDRVIKAFTKILTDLEG